MGAKIGNPRSRPRLLQRMRTPTTAARLLVPAISVAAALPAACAPLRAQEREDQDTTQLVTLGGLHVEVPRPIATTGGRSAVEFDLDSAGAVAAPTMEELLRRMPAVQIRANSRGEAQPDLRGAEDRQVAILLDGVPLTIGWDHRTDISIVPLTAVRAMTLYRGLSSMLHGPNVLGGAIEFDVGRGAALRPDPTPLNAQLALDEVGAVSASAVASFRREIDGGAWLVRAGGGYRRSPGATVPGGAAEDRRVREELLADSASGWRLNSDRRLSDCFLSARYRGDGGAWASGLVAVSDAERGVPPETHVASPRLWRYPHQGRITAAISGGSGAHAAPFGEGEVEISLGLDRSTTEIEAYESAAYEKVADGETGTTTTLSARLLGDHRFDWGPEARTALTFARVSHDEAFRPDEKFAYEQRLWSLGTEVEIGSDDILRSGAGLTRWTLGASIDGADTPLSGDKEPLDALWDWGARAGVSRVLAGGSLLLHAGVSRRTRFPSLRELYSGALGRFMPNAELRPETMVAGEVGLTLDDGERQLQVVGFRNRLANGIVRESVPTTQGILFRRVNRDEVRSRGVEVMGAGTLGPGTVGVGMTWQSVLTGSGALASGVALTRDDVLADDRPVEYAPALAGTATVGVKMPGQLLVSGFVRYRGVQRCANIDATVLDEMEASATLDLEATRSFVGARGDGEVRVDAAVAVSNLTDATVMDQCGLPQPGRTLRIQLLIR